MRHDTATRSLWCGSSRFQSTCLREARLSPAPGRLAPPRFQSTCLREARPATLFLYFLSTNFNPRACVRHDFVAPSWVLGMVFQSTCLREARLSRGVVLKPDGTFQSTCLREARPTRRISSGVRLDFNPRACVRHDPARYPDSTGCGFQSTCLREARPLWRCTCHLPPDFNPRACVRHDKRV